VSEVVKLERHDEVGIVTVNSPPVNALSAAVRGGILECIKDQMSSTHLPLVGITLAAVPCPDTPRCTPCRRSSSTTRR